MSDSNEITLLNAKIMERLIYTCSVTKKEYLVEVTDITSDSIIVNVIADVKYKPMEFIGFKNLRRPS